MPVALTDLTANKYSLTNNGVTVSASVPFAGLVGSAIFNGSSNLPGSNFSALQITGSITVECWVKRGALGACSIVSKYITSTNQRAWELIFQGDNLVGMQFSDNGTNSGGVASVTAITSLTDWVHIAISCTTGTRDCSIYINGVLNQNSASPTGLPTFNSSSIVALGSQGDNNNKFTGLMSEVRVWNVARTGTEIANNYNKKIDPTTSGLVAYWRLDDTASFPGGII